MFLKMINRVVIAGSIETPYVCGSCRIDIIREWMARDGDSLSFRACRRAMALFEVSLESVIGGSLFVRRPTFGHP